MVRLLQADPFLDGVGPGGVRRVPRAQPRRRPRPRHGRSASGARCAADLRVLVMSATLDPEPVAAYLGDCPRIEAPGRLHPVAVRHAERPLARDPRGLYRELERALPEAVRGVLGETDGDVLVFLPGVGEIRAAEEALAPLARERDLALVRLHGRLPLGEQDAALRPQPRRKVILATNVAESSVTVEGVTAVVDTGLARQMRHDLASRHEPAGADPDQPRLRRPARRPGRPHRPRRLPAPVARDRARGAAGARPARGRPAWSSPARSSSCSPGARATRRPSPGSRPPAPEALAAAGAAPAPPGRGRATAGLTALGRTLARLPVHPRLGRLLVEGDRLGHGARGGAARRAALRAAAVPPVRTGGRPRTALGALRPPRPPRRAGGVRAPGRRLASGASDGSNRGAARFVLASRDQLAGLLQEAGGGRRPEATRTDREEALLRALFAAHPDRLVRRREPGEPAGGDGRRPGRAAGARERGGRAGAVRGGRPRRRPAGRALGGAGAPRLGGRAGVAAGGADRGGGRGAASTRRASGWWRTG